MNYTFQRVAAFCGLRLSYYITAALLALAFLVLAFTNYRTATPLYILLTLAVLPSILRSLLSSGINPDTSPSAGKKKEEKRENGLAFPLFCEKYKYNLISYRAMNIAYLLLFLLFAAWHISYGSAETMPFLVTGLPALIATLCLLIRILGVLCYRLYFRFFPLRAMR